MLVAPSLLSADLGHLDRDIRRMESAGADWMHIDVMDGQFVPNISFGLPIVKAARASTNVTLDVHLMMVQPERYIENFAQAGADVLTIHVEASLHLHRSLMAIRQAGMKAGVALNPHTPVALLEDVLDCFDLVCIMSVNPGFGGQTFIHQTLKKVTSLVSMREDGAHDFLIEVDGGVRPEQGAALRSVGVDVAVAGHALFSAEDPAAVVRALKGARGSR
ncbi:MAG: ribulose-phosphate 3-epimerase [Bacteroidia bacterium]